MTLQSDLERECRLFSKYLIELWPSEYVLKKYQEAHQLGHPSLGRPIQLFDDILIWLARRHTFVLRLADTYAGLFYKDALLRRKLVLLLAILECSPGAFEQLDRPEVRTQPALYGLCILKGLTLAAMSLLAVAILAPTHITCQSFGRWRDR